MLSALAKERKLVEKFLAALRALPDVRVEADLEPVTPRLGVPRQRIDAQVDVRMAGKTVTLITEAKKLVYPRDARLVIWALRDVIRRWPREPDTHEILPVLIAESISTGAKKLLRDEGAGYFDSGGSMFLAARGTYLYVDKPEPKRESRYMRTLFAGRRAQVLHALLIHRRDWFQVKGLAELASVSTATASQVMTALERFEWVKSRGKGPNKERCLQEPAALLDAWVQWLAMTRPTAMRHYYVPLVRADELVERIGLIFSAHGVEYAITREAAGQRYTPFLSSFSQVHCRLLPGQAADQAIDMLGARVVREGTNLVVIEAESPGELLFRQKVSGTWLASPVQVYLDLVHSEGRAKELAEHLRQERIGP